MKNPFQVSLVGCLFCLVFMSPPEGNAQTSPPSLEAVASFPDQQLTGVAVSKTGRVFVNFPDWSENHSVSVVEVLPDGSSKPYPNEAWNSKEGPVASRFVCVQSVHVDDEDMLWILDAAAPKMEAVVPGGAKLVKVDLKSGEVVKAYGFDESVAPAKSYLNDVRVDRVNGHAFITESGVGAIIVLDLKSGKARRLLDGHFSTKSEPEVNLAVEGVSVLDPKTGKAPQIHADGLAWDKEGGWLYYRALTGHILYRVKTADIMDPKLSAADLEKKVENLITTAAADGMLEAGNGSVYLTDIENSAITHYDPPSKELITILIDPAKLLWPDTLAASKEGYIYVTASQIHLTPKFNKGQNKQKGPFTLYRFKLNPPRETEATGQTPVTESVPLPAAVPPSGL